MTMRSALTNLLQEVRSALSLRALEPTTLEEVEYVLPWALVHNLTLR